MWRLACAAAGSARAPATRPAAAPPHPTGHPAAQPPGCANFVSEFRDYEVFLGWKVKLTVTVPHYAPRHRLTLNRHRTSTPQLSTDNTSQTSHLLTSVNSLRLRLRTRLSSLSHTLSAVSAPCLPWSGRCRSRRGRTRGASTPSSCVCFYEFLEFICFL